MGTFYLKISTLAEVQNKFMLILNLAKAHGPHYGDGAGMGMVRAGHMYRRAGRAAGVLIGHAN